MYTERRRCFGDYQFDGHYTDDPGRILKYLHRHANRIVSRQVLLDEVWGYNAGVTSHTLETHVYRLRQKIEIDPAHSRLLLTAPGGYRLDLTAS